MLTNISTIAGVGYRVENGQLRTNSKNPIRFAPATTQEHLSYAQHDCEQRLKELGFSPSDNAFTAVDPFTGNEVQTNMFEATEHKYYSAKGNALNLYGTSILYTDHKGSAYKSKHGTGHIFTRFRFARDLEWTNQEGDKIKYLSPKNSGSFAWCNGLYKYFFSKGITDFDRLVIVEGEFKAAALCKAGVPAIGIGGIHLGVNTIKNEYGRTTGAELLPEILAVINDLPKKPKLIFLHDADARDNDGKPERAIAFFSSVRNMFSACQAAGVDLIYKHVLSSSAKGVDDLLNAYPKRKKEICADLENLYSTQYFKSFRIDTWVKLKQLEIYFKLRQDRVDFPLQVKQYAGEKTGDLIKLLKEHGKLRLLGGTGIGKTTLVMEDICKLWPDQVVIVQPLLSIVDNLKKLYPDAVIIKGGAESFDYETAAHAKIVACTYDSLYKLIPYLQENHLIVADEIHYPIQGDNWKIGKHYDIAFNHVVTHMHCLCMSATAPDLAHHGFKTVEIRAEQRNKLTIYRRDYKGKIHHELKRLLNDTDYSKGPVIVRWNTGEDKIEDLCKELNTDRVAVLRSSTKKDKVFQQLIDTNYLPEGYDIFFITSVADCGLSIYNDNVQYLVNVDGALKATTSDIKQFAHRLRRISDIQLYNYKKQSDSRFFYVQKNLLRKLMDYARKAQEHENTGLELHKTECPTFKGQLPISFKSNYDTLIYNPVAQRFDINYLYINHIYNKEIEDRYSNDVFYWRLEAEDYITVIDEGAMQVAEDPELSKSDNNRKELKKKRRNQLTSLLLKDPYLFAQVYLNYIDNYDLAKDIKKTFPGMRKVDDPRSRELYNEKQELFDSKAGDLLLKRYCQLKRRKAEELVCSETLMQDNNSFSQLLSRIDWHSCIDNVDQLSGPIKADTERMIEHREDLEMITTFVRAEVIADIINRRRPDGHRLTTRKALLLARTLLEWDESSERDEMDKKHRLYMPTERAKVPIFSKNTGTDQNLYNNVLSEVSSKPDLFTPAPF